MPCHRPVGPIPGLVRSVHGRVCFAWWGEPDEGEVLWRLVALAFDFFEEFLRVYFGEVGYNTCLCCASRASLEEFLNIYRYVYDASFLNDRPIRLVT